jgi:hypothetical protein
VLENLPRANKEVILYLLKVSDKEDQKKKGKRDNNRK